MELKNDFETFLTGIRPTESQREDMKTGHKTLRERLREYGIFTSHHKRFPAG